MSKVPSEHRRVLAIDPTSRGFGFVLLEGPHRLIDWGVAHARVDKHRRCLARVANLIAHYEPEVIVLEDGAGRGSRRCARVRQLLQDIQRLATARNIATRSFSRSKVRRAFEGANAHTKHQIAKTIAGRFPELVPHLPPFRKPWMREHDRMSIFDALGLALTLLHFEHKRRKRPTTAQSSS
jgi:Holliday junction resolvasome RuvABC endonuclease subunit